MVAMANSGPNTNASQVHIANATAPFFNQPPSHIYPADLTVYRAYPRELHIPISAGVRFQLCIEIDSKDV